MASHQCTAQPSQARPPPLSSPPHILPHAGSRRVSAPTGRPIEGIWHTALVLYGVEIFYGQGVSVVSPPGTSHHGSPTKQIPCGVTHLDKQTVLDYVDALRDTYRAEAYHLLEFNCNTFTNDALGFLNGRQIPRDIRDQPSDIMSTPFGQQMRPMIESMFVGRRTPSAGAAVNHLVPQLGLGTPPATPPTAALSRTPAPSAAAVADDVPSLQSLSSNLSICTSPASLRTTLATSPATALMFTRPSCPPCASIRPHFEALARTHPRTAFVLVETHLGSGAQVASSPEFGGPISATPSFVFFARGGAQTGACRGADKAELEAQLGILHRTAFSPPSPRPPHAHARLALPALEPLAQRLDPLTNVTWPARAALEKKLDEALVAAASRGGGADPRAGEDVLRGTVVRYLSSLPAPPAPAPAPSTPLQQGLLAAWLPATLSFLRAAPAPAAAFPVLDLVRLALARDGERLAAEGAFGDFVDELLGLLAVQLDGEGKGEGEGDARQGRGQGERAYLLTALRTLCNALASPALARRVLAPSSASGARSSATRLVLCALLDTRDARTRREGAGAAWSVVGRVFAERVGGEGAEDGEEEWEAEVGSAVLEALGNEEESVEVGASLPLVVLPLPRLSCAEAWLTQQLTRSAPPRRDTRPPPLPIPALCLTARAPRRARRAGRPRAQGGARRAAGQGRGGEEGREGRAEGCGGAARGRGVAGRAAGTIKAVM